MREVLQRMPELLLPWFAENRRDLPWRRDREPYHIWVSEIMLQQTRVEAVRGYYTRFLQALPTVADLAEVPEDVLGKLWEGLGYYSRSPGDPGKVGRRNSPGLRCHPQSARRRRLHGRGHLLHCLRYADACGGRERPSGVGPSFGR